MPENVNQHAISNDIPLSFEEIGKLLYDVNEGIIGVNIFGCCSFANPKALESLKIENTSQLIGQPVLQYLNFDRDFTHSSTLEYITQLKNQSSKSRHGYLLTQEGKVEEVHIWQKPLMINDQYSGSIIGFNSSSNADIPQPSSTQLSSGIERYKLLLESTQVVVWEYDLASNFFTFISPQAENVFGYPIRLWYSRGFWEEKIHPIDKERAIYECNTQVTKNDNYELEYRMIKADGEIIYIRDYVTVVKEDDTPIALRGIFADITEQKSNEEKQRLSASVFESSDAVTITNRDKEIIQVNRAFTEITGYEPEEVIGKNPSILSSGKQEKSFYQKMWKDITNNHHWQGEIWNKRKNGEIYAEWLTITPVFDEYNEVCNYVGIFSDISGKKESEREIEFQNSHDPLTLLPNRAMLYRKLKEAILESKKHKNNGALLFLDLDEFKLINDSMGHKYGDILLNQVADRLNSCISSGDTLARIGGDEFAILVPSISINLEQSRCFIDQLSQQLQDVFTKSFHINDRQLHVSSSIGVSTFSEDDHHASDILRQADTAMFRAKETGKNQVRSFTPDMHSKIERHLFIHNELSVAIKRNELSIHLQPQFNSNEKIITAEALLRWNHKEQGNITPSEFIPIAEQTGLIISLGDFVITSVCKLIAKWKVNKHYSLKRIDVNVSCQQFEENDFYLKFKNTLDKYNVSPNEIGLELTEEIMVGDIDKIIDTLLKLKELGIHFALDDFGTGYSSLRYIKRLPIDNLKIDQSFISDIPHDNIDCIMVNTIMAMARQMNFSVTAEGIENVEQKAFLQNLDCDFYQGFLFSKPLSVEDFERLIFKDV